MRSKLCASPTRSQCKTRSSPCSSASGAVCTSSGRTERPAPFRYGPPLARDLGQRGCCPDCLVLIAAVAGRTCCGGHSTFRRTSTRTSTSTSSLRLDGAPSRRRHQRGTRIFAQRFVRYPVWLNKEIEKELDSVAVTGQLYKLRWPFGA